MFRRLHDDDRGVALLVALAVTSIAAALATVIVGIALSEAYGSGRDRQRTVSADAAEAGVDLTYAQIQTATPTTLPCTLNGAVKAAPDNPTYSVTVTYYDDAGTTLTCPPTATDSPAKALISSTATAAQDVAGGVARSMTMQALVNLVPVRANGFNKAILGNTGISLSNSGNVHGNDGPDADIYSNGDITCTNNEYYAGRVIAAGSITFTNGSSCQTAGDLWAGHTVTTAKGAVGGAVLAAGGAVSLSGTTSVTSTVQASGSISWSSCNASKCYPNTTVPVPPSQPFPIVRDDATTIAQWQAAGFTELDSYTNCATVVSDIVNKLKSLSADTVITTPCAVGFSKNKGVLLAHDVAIFAEGGFSASQLTTFDSTTSDIRRMYWIVPYNAAASLPCSSPGITTGNQFSSGNYVQMMLYSPCNITFANNGTYQGQVYSGSTVTTSNNFDLTYRPLPMYGVDPDSLPVQSYDVDVDYKRQVTPGP